MARDSGRPWAPYGFEARLMEALRRLRDRRLGRRARAHRGRRPVPAAARRGDAARRPGAGLRRPRRPGEPAAARPAAAAVDRSTAWSASAGPPPRSTCTARAADVPADARVVRPGGRGRRRALVRGVPGPDPADRAGARPPRRRRGHRPARRPGGAARPGPGPDGRRRAGDAAGAASASGRSAPRAWPGWSGRTPSTCGCAGWPTTPRPRRPSWWPPGSGRSRPSR